jgi:hypothetical protein
VKEFPLKISINNVIKSEITRWGILWISKNDEKLKKWWCKKKREFEKLRRLSFVLQKYLE